MTLSTPSFFSKGSGFSVARLVWVGLGAFSLGALIGNPLASLDAPQKSSAAAQPAAPASNPSTANTKPLTSAKVVAIEDGDTFIVITAGKREKVRLIGYDAPELSEGNQPSQCFALQATERPKADLLGKTVALQGDALHPDRDPSGRLLRYVQLGGKDYGKFLIENGYGHEYSYKARGHSLQQSYQEAQFRAENAQQGLWSNQNCDGNTRKAAIFQNSAYLNAVVPKPGQPITCASFATRNQAQRFYEARGGPFQDQYGLDKLRNGRACPQLP